MSRKYVKILNVPIDSTSTSSVLGLIEEKLKAGNKFLIFTPNPEIVLAAQKDKMLLKILNKADICLPDGAGLIYASKLLSLKGPLKVVKGREIFVSICERASKKNWKVFLLGGKKGVSKKAANNLLAKYKNLRIHWEQGPFLDMEGKPLTEKDRIGEMQATKKINEVRPDVLFVGFGCPKQEKWSYHWLNKLKVGGIMVVGGAFDCIGGTTKLPPKWLADMGFEWLWRLYHEPKRIRRILAAIITFPLAVLRFKLTDKEI